MKPQSVLVAGASIAGPALSYLLARRGFRVVVVERAAEFRRGGQNVDIRGAARRVLRSIGIEDEVRRATTGEKGVLFVDEHNITKAAFPAGTSETEGFTAEFEILRGDLAAILYERTRADVEYVFGDQITSLDDLDENGQQTRVTFQHGPERIFDFVVAADGIRSRTRALVVSAAPTIRELGLYTAYFTIPRGETDTAWARWFNAPGGRTILVRPDNVGTTRVMLSFLSPPLGYERLAPDQQKALLQRVFADIGWEAPRVLSGLAASTDMYFESIGQVHAPQWSSRRGALLGDAAWCASPISGMGTSLALVGAYVLAGELSKQPTRNEAFAAYERVMRPFVEQAQNLPPGAPRLAHPKTRMGIKLFNTLMRVISSPLATKLQKRFGSPRAEAIELPAYEATTLPHD